MLPPQPLHLSRQATLPLAYRIRMLRRPLRRPTWRLRETLLNRRAARLLLRLELRTRLP